MRAELKSITSADLNRGDLPQDVDDCAIAVEVEIGPMGQPGADLFQFVAITPRALERAGNRWGRGLLIVPVFSWESVDSALHQLLTRVEADTWSEVAAELSRELHWEYEDYRPPGV